MKWLAIILVILLHGCGYHVTQCSPSGETETCVIVFGLSLSNAKMVNAMGEFVQEYEAEVVTDKPIN
jgi:hypothetical protein